jgi:hypothetical protein
LKTYEDSFEIENYIARLAAGRAYFEFLAHQTAQKYKDYYKDDKFEDFKFLENIGENNRALLIREFGNRILGKSKARGYRTFSKRPWTQSVGLWSNFLAGSAQTRTLSFDAGGYLSDIAKEDQRVPHLNQVANEGVQIKSLEQLKQIADEKKAPLNK